MTLPPSALLPGDYLPQYRAYVVTTASDPANGGAWVRDVATKLSYWIALDTEVQVERKPREERRGAEPVADWSDGD